MLKLKALYYTIKTSPYIFLGTWYKLRTSYYRYYSAILKDEEYEFKLKLINERIKDA